MGKDVVASLGDRRQEKQIELSVERLLGDEAVTMDQEARDRADDAANRIKTHEEVCAERWRGAQMASEMSRTATERLEVAVAKLQKALDNRIPSMNVAIMTAMAGIIGWLADRAFPFH